MILLDTHVAVWLSLEPERLSGPARKAMEKARREGAGIAICGETLYEIARGIVRGRIQTTYSVEVFLQKMEEQFVIKQLTTQVAIAAAKMSANYPGDPMDRVIGATALVEDIPLVTADQRIREAKIVRTIW